MPTVLTSQQVGPTRTSSLGEDDEERSPNGFNTSGSSFTKKLYEILDSAESCDIVCWTQDGTAFEVKEPKRLEVEILPKYFRHARFQSFVRQLNFYSFKKVSKERSSWIYSHECFQKNKPDLLDRLRRKTNTSTLPSGVSAGGEKRMYEMYATSVGLQDHEMASTLKVLRGNNASDGVYYYGQQGHSSGRKHQWGYEDDCRGTPSDGGEAHPTNRAHQVRSEYEAPGESRLSKHAMQSWDSMRLEQKAGRDGEREPSTSQEVSSLAFLYGIPASQVLSTLPASSSAISAMGSSSDGNRSPDSDDPSEAATDNSQSSRSLCGSKIGDRGSISSVSLSSAESSHKRSCHSHHSHHNGNNAQWQAGFDQTDSRLPKVPGYQNYEQDGYSSIYSTYLPQPRSHSSQHHQVPFRPAAQQQQLLYAQQIHGQLQTQAQTQAQMMHTRYLNYQQNLRQVQGREQGAPKVAPIVIPSFIYPSKREALAIATLLDDHEHWMSKPLVVKNVAPPPSDYPQGCYSDGSVSTDVADSYLHAKDIALISGQGSEKTDREGKCVLRAFPPQFEGSNVEVQVPSEVARVNSQSKEIVGNGEELSKLNAARGSVKASSGDDQRRVEEEGEQKDEGPAGGNLVLDEPLGDATHALLSFCMQRNPWMYSESSEEDCFGSEGGPLGSGPVALYKDVTSCLFDTPLLREELDSYSEALNPSPFPVGSARRASKCSVASRKRRSGSNGAGCSEGYNSDESTADSLTDEDSDEQLSIQARSLSCCNNKLRKKDAVEEIRAFTIFASLRMQEVSDLVCEQEVRRASRRELDKNIGVNNWSRGDGTSRDLADSAAAAAFTKALETCTQTWWAYANLYK